MKRVLVIGPGGSGKSTLSTALGEILGIEVIHLDRFYWSAGWIEMPKDKWATTVDELLSRDAWIMDGNYSGTLAKRISASDTIPRFIATLRKNVNIGFVEKVRAKNDYSN